MKLPTPRQLKNGKWIVRVRVNGNDVSKVFESEKDAHAWGIQQKLNPPVRKSAEEKTIRQLIDEYVSYNDFARNTMNAYNALKTHFRQFMDRPYKDIKNWQYTVSAEELNPNTTAMYWGKICAVLRFHGLDVPTVKIRRKPAEKKEYLTGDEIKRLCDVIRGHRYEFYYLMMLSSCRLSEALNIKETDRTSDGFHIRGTKTDASDRFIPYLFPRLIELPVPPTPAPTTVQRDLRKICVLNDFPHLSCHSLRVSFASLCYQKNVPERVAMKIGGWQSVQVFHQVYVRIADDDVNRYADDIRKAFE